MRGRGGRAVLPAWPSCLRRPSSPHAQERAAARCRRAPSRKCTRVGSRKVGGATLRGTHQLAVRALPPSEQRAICGHRCAVVAPACNGHNVHTLHRAGGQAGAPLRPCHQRTAPSAPALERASPLATCCPVPARLAGSLPNSAPSPLLPSDNEARCASAAAAQPASAVTAPVSTTLKPSPACMSHAASSAPQRARVSAGHG